MNREVRLISDEHFNETSKTRSQALTVKIDYETNKRIAFTVTDPKTQKKHSVLYNYDKKPPLDWNCDCKWHSNQFPQTRKYCAHVHAAQKHAQKTLKIE